MAVVVTGSGDLPDRTVLEQSLQGKVFGMPVQVEVLGSTRFGFATR